ncbi:MAG: HAD family phosphatase [Clostridia bacterium]|nr:HAD family phosphatase [Clostridia bacterium]
MIKLIASDLDGTLLLPDGSLPEESLELIELLHQKGVIFCVASGRQYESLKRLFAPVADKVLFIAENGALVFYKGQQLFGEYLSVNYLSDILSAVKRSGGYPLLCAAEYAYAEDDYSPFQKEYQKYYPNVKKLADLQTAPELNAICKVAVFDERGSSDFSGKTLQNSLPSLRITVSGKVWTDISMPETNKGKAMAFIQEHFGFAKAECVAFGDYMNDLELLLACKHAYVTENGFAPLKEKIQRVIPSNAERGVIKKIQQILKELT